MNVWDIIILIFVIALLSFAVWLNVHKKKKGGGCCGESGCSGNCAACCRECDKKE